jgi:hypothetical protein
MDFFSKVFSSLDGYFLRLRKNIFLKHQLSAISDSSSFCDTFETFNFSRKTSMGSKNIESPTTLTVRLTTETA